MTTIYGLRQIGTTEIRYVGQTGKSLEYRLMQHKAKAHRGYPERVATWVKSVGSGIEIVALAECAEGSRWTVERAVVEALVAVGHRLTNSHLNPSVIAEARTPAERAA